MGDAPGGLVPPGPRDGLTRPGWAAEVNRELGRFSQWLRERLVVEPRENLIPATRFFDPEFLRGVIDEFRAEPMATDGSHRGAKRADTRMAIAVSRFARRYSGPVTAVALTGLAAGIGLDVSPERCWVEVQPGLRYAVALDVPAGTVLRCVERPTSWSVDGRQVESLEELRRAVWASLYGAHLAPMLTLLRDLTGGPQTLMWTSAAEYATMLADDAEELLPAEERAPYVGDRAALFGAAHLPGVSGPNPMRDAIAWFPVDGYPFPSVATRRLCCLSYLLAMRDGALCSSCPHLPLADRAALAYEDQRRPVDGEVGAARERSRQIGRQRPSFGRV